MAKVDLFTPIHFESLRPESCSQKLMIAASTAADDLFYWGGKVAHVTPGSLLSETTNTLLADHRAYQPFYAVLLKVLAYATVILPVIALAIKAAVRWTHDFQVIDGAEWGKRVMEGEFAIPEGLQERLQGSIRDVMFDHRNSNVIQHRHRLSGETVFQLEGYEEDIICKMNFNGRMSAHFDNIARAKAICFTHHLGDIHIPPTQAISVQNDTLIDDVLVQEFISGSVPTLEQSAREDQISTRSIAQLTRLIAETGLRKIHPSNLRVLNNGQIARLDFKRIDTQNKTENSALKTILLDRGYRHDSMNGLVAQLYYPHQVKAMLDVAAQYGVRLSSEESKELKDWMVKRAAITEWQQSKGLTPSSLIEIDNLNYLGLPLDETAQIPTRFIPTDRGIQEANPVQITLRKAARDVIGTINDAISTREGTWERRRVVLETGGLSTLGQYRSIPPRHDLILMSDQEYFRQIHSIEHNSWLGRILDALKAKGAIFSWDYFNGGVEIQA